MNNSSYDDSLYYYCDGNQMGLYIILSIFILPTLIGLIVSLFLSDHAPWCTFFFNLMSNGMIAIIIAGIKCYIDSSSDGELILSGIIFLVLVYALSQLIGNKCWAPEWHPDSESIELKRGLCNSLCWLDNSPRSVFDEITSPLLNESDLETMQKENASLPPSMSVRIYLHMRFPYHF